MSLPQTERSGNMKWSPVAKHRRNDSYGNLSAQQPERNTAPSQTKLYIFQPTGISRPKLDSRAFLQAIYEHSTTHNRHAGTSRRMPAPSRLPLWQQHQHVRDKSRRKDNKDTSSFTTAFTNGQTLFHMNLLGSLGLLYFTQLYTLSIQSANTPSIWRPANIIQIQRAGKPRHLGSSYHTILFLCLAIKVLDWVIFPVCTSHLKITETQQGFRNHRFTTSALLQLVNKMATCFNKPRSPPHSTKAVSIDFTKAFNTVNLT